MTPPVAAEELQGAGCVPLGTQNRTAYLRDWTSFRSTDRNSEWSQYSEILRLTDPICLLNDFAKPGDNLW